MEKGVQMTFEDTLSTRTSATISILKAAISKDRFAMESCLAQFGCPSTFKLGQTFTLDALMQKLTELSLDILTGKQPIQYVGGQWRAEMSSAPHTHGQAGNNPCFCDSPPVDRIATLENIAEAERKERERRLAPKDGTRPGDSRITLGASDTNHPEEPHYGNVGNTINPHTGRYDGF